MIVILDLDYTLLDTAAFKNALVDVFDRCGVDQKRFNSSYRAVIEAHHPEYDYDPERHLEILRDELSCSVDDVRKGIESVLGNIGSYFYPGVHEFLDELRSRGARLVLLTMGNKEWQRAKIEHSGLGRLFDDTRFVDKEKESVIGELIEGDSEVFVINDNPKEIAAMVRQEPRLHYILKKGPKGTIEGLDVPVFERFEDIVSFIDETLKQ